jgi:hypothetical protein
MGDSVDRSVRINLSLILFFASIAVLPVTAAGVLAIAGVARSVAISGTTWSWELRKQGERFASLAIASSVLFFVVKWKYHSRIESRFLAARFSDPRMPYLCPDPTKEIEPQHKLRESSSHAAATS